MLYLFLTGKRSAYLNAIFTVLSLPKGMTYDLKYRDLENESIVESSAKNFNKKLSEKVLVLFNNGDGDYVPLRFGRLKKWRKEEGQIYYSVQMREFCNYKMKEEFCEFIDRIAPIPIRTATSPGKVKGILAFRKGVEVEEIIEQAEDSWIKTVRILGKEELFKKYYSIFTKIEVTEKGRKIDANNVIRLKTEHNYMICTTYYIPEFNVSPMEYIPIKYYESNKSLGIVENMDGLLSEQNVIEIPCFAEGKNIGKRKNAFRYEILKDEVNGRSVQYARTPIEVDIEGKMPRLIYYFCVALVIILLGVANYYNSAILDENSSKKLIAFISGGITILTCALVKLIGKPKL